MFANHRHRLPRRCAPFHEQLVIAGYDPKEAVIAGPDPQSMTSGLPGSRIGSGMTKSEASGMTTHVQGPCAVSGRIRQARNDGAGAFVFPKRRLLARQKLVQVLADQACRIV